MPASSRIHRRAYNDPGHAHEFTFSCHRKLPLLKAERTCRWLCEAIDRARARLEFDLWAFVFMPEHVHLIVHPRKSTYDIAAILREIKQPVSRQAIAFLRKESPDWLKHLAVSKGETLRYQFWMKGGGYDRNIVEPRTLHQMIEYLHLNPVRRGLVDRARDFPWSSAAWFEETGIAPIRLDAIPPEWCIT